MLEGEELLEWPEVWDVFGGGGLWDGLGINTEFTEDTESTEAESGRRDFSWARNSARSSWMSFHST